MRENSKTKELISLVLLLMPYRIRWILEEEGLLVFDQHVIEEAFERSHCAFWATRHFNRKLFHVCLLIF